MSAAVDLNKLVKQIKVSDENYGAKHHCYSFPFLAASYDRRP